MQRFSPTIFAASLLAASCGGETLDFKPTVAAPLGTSIDACPLLGTSATVTTGTGDVVVTRMCVRDEHGNYYPGMTDPNVAQGQSGWQPELLPAGHTYALVYQFSPDWIPPAGSAVAKAGAMYVGPSTVTESSPCGGSGAPATAASMTSLESGDLVVQQLMRPVASGDYVSAVLQVGALFPGTCSNTDPSPGVFCYSGLGDMFYVGTAPPPAPPGGGPATVTAGCGGESGGAGGSGGSPHGGSSEGSGGAGGSGGSARGGSGSGSGGATTTPDDAGVTTGFVDAGTSSD